MIAKLLYRLWSFFVNSRRLWELLDHTGIVVFVGANGSGKSLVMVESETAALDGIPWECFDVDHIHHRPFVDHAAGCGTCDRDLVRARRVADRGALDDLPLCADGRQLYEFHSSGIRKIYSTVQLLDGDEEHPHYVPLRDYRQLLSIEHADVLFDEVAGIADASGSASMPVQVVNWQHKLRKADVKQRVTTPAFQRCALPIRQVAQVVVEMRSFFPTRVVGKVWRPRRLVYAVAYDAFEFEGFVASDSQRSKLRAMARGLVWVPNSRAINHYNSFGQVISLGHVTDTGMCIACGGSRSKPRCACGPDVDLSADDLRVVDTVSASGTRVRRVEVGR